MARVCLAVSALLSRRDTLTLAGPTYRLAQLTGTVMPIPCKRPFPQSPQQLQMLAGRVFG